MKISPKSFNRHLIQFVLHSASQMRTATFVTPSIFVYNGSIRLGNTNYIVKTIRSISF